MYGLRQDVSYAVRGLRRSPVFTAGVLVVLALGIGATTTLFSVVDTVLLRSLPVPEADRLVTVWESAPAREIEQFPASRGNFAAWRERSRSFESVAGLMEGRLTLTDAGPARRAHVGVATAALLPMLGQEPHLGRGFLVGDEQPGADPVCLLSHRFWRSVLGGDPAILGQSLSLGGVGRTVIGVLPPRTPLFEAVEVWLPLELDPAAPIYWDNRQVRVFARLQSGTSLAQANAEIAALTRRLGAEQPAWNDGVEGFLLPLHEHLVGDVRANLLILLGAVAALLLIACVNVAGLLLARGMARQRELAMRSALGAGRGRLLRQLLAESALLASGGGLLGLAAAYGGVRAVVGWGPSSVPRLAEVAVDLRVAVFALAVTGLTGLVCGLLPAVQTCRRALPTALRTRRALADRRTTARSVLVIAEVALALVLSIGSGLLLRSYLSLHRVDAGFQAANRLALRLDLPSSRYPEMVRVASFYRRLAERLEALPGVVSARAGTSLPLVRSTAYKWMTLEERPAQRTEDIPGVDYSVVQPGYLATLGVPLNAGRRLEPGDDEEAPYVAVVNEAFVREHYAAGEEPLGRRVRMGPPEHLEVAGSDIASPSYRIVGVVADVRYESLTSPARPAIYVPLGQPKSRVDAFFLVVHTVGDPRGVVAAVRQAVMDLDPELPILSLQPMTQVAAATVAGPRFNLTLIGAFAAAAMLLAAAGLYTLLSYTVGQRTHELGLRMAIGADRRDILRLVLGRGAWLASVGIGLGCLTAALVTRFMESLLFGVAATDPATFAGVSAWLAVVTLLAGLPPAVRAARLSPTAALRGE